ncbi:MAG TPA: hypothetical protein PLD49_08085 [Thermoclostridium caenicola]|uniref:NfeD-like C-terminal, partner-binding n=1 Tax=Thermoclostridium caenicola TaxID=659425 RepID=A0A1M6HWV3_9FIRM|nr:hypothetical protein [Thermoclostridium caenicola]SHJ26643.1 hypothetical protein SAMN05444373_103611 [Thermoclostridium caenicola]HOK43609.1 hypothetical protein [Thermoclostridium caenicola]HOL83698.1 hypothetical protein [Thermoclostridium caenicola]HOP72573.1 hypothetical protein [Thermoclostridium caenicola]HPO75909.1 hypothetical protein [Thermoclostridium caenicola]
MVDWWNGLSTLQQLFACFAIPATLVLVIQIILFIIGLSDGDGDADVSHDVADGDGAGADAADHVGDLTHSHDVAEVRLFTLRSIVAFFAVGGWTGVVLAGLELPLPAVIVFALMAGWAALYFVTWSIRMALRLQYSGNIDVSNAIGKVGEVYMTIPAANRGYGKINVMVQERFCEFEATTSADRDLKTGESVFVTGITEDNVLTVIPNDEVSTH